MYMYLLPRLLTGIKPPTAWSGPRTADEFIEISRAGKERGVFIMHRECGTLVELNQAAGRAVGKMKATITQRFRDEETGAEFDVDCDCQFFFFCAKDARHQPQAQDNNHNHTNGAAATTTTTTTNGSSANPEAGAPAARIGFGAGGGAWKAHFVKLVYCKDKIVPADGVSAPRLTSAELLEMETYPEGYRYLGIMQKRLGYKIDLQLPTPRNQGWADMYRAMEDWLAGETTINL